MQRKYKVLVAVSAAGFLVSARAQLGNREAPAVVGHYHLNVSSVEEHKRFWVDTLGGEAFSFGEEGIDAISFPGVFLFLEEQSPTGPTRGTSFDHIGFAVPDVAAVARRSFEAGFERTVGREPGPGQPDNPPTAGNYGAFEYLVGPDGVKVELVTADGDDAPPIAHHHVHFVSREFVAMQEWYIEAFNASPRDVLTDFYAGAELPGVGYSLNFFSWLPAEDLTGTAGRAVDHVGFDVLDLEAFVAELAGKGIEPIEPLHREGDLLVAKIVDPWGTVIELTEGLREHAAASELEPLVSIMELMQQTITPATNQLWSAWKPPETPAEWRLMEEAAVSLLAAASLTGTGGTGAMDNTWVEDPVWQAFNQVMISAGRKALEASRAQDAEALLAAGDELLPPCEGCHQRFNPAVVGAAP